ncbi:MAG: hypothetical protein IJV09_06410 [Prevotella sp.]|nr:hypothetical protein [Prevotella sp.]
MKKLFTLIAAALFAANVSADEVTLWENVTDGQVLNIADIEAAGGADADIVTFYLEDNTGTDHTGWGMGGYGPSSGWDTDFPFTGNGTSWREETTVGEIKSLAGTNPGVRVRLYNGAELKKVTLQPSITYGEAQTITVTDGFIPASEFAGLSDAAIIEFTYKVEGDITDYVGWGIGRIGSNDDTGEGPSVEIASLPAKALGEAVYKCKMIDIKPALVASPDGILVSFWGFGDGKCTASLVKVEAFDVVSGDEPENSSVISFTEAKAAGALNGQTLGKGFTLTVTDTKSKISIDGNKQYFGTVAEWDKYEFRLKTGGKNDSNNALKLTLPSAGTLIVAMRSSSSTDTRNVAFMQGGTEVKSFEVKDANAEKGTVDGIDDKTVFHYYTIDNAPAGDINITYSGGTNFYAFILKTATGIYTIGTDNIVKNDVIYNLAGQKVNENYKGIVIKNGKKYIQK